MADESVIPNEDAQTTDVAPVADAAPVVENTTVDLPDLEAPVIPQVPQSTQSDGSSDGAKLIRELIEGQKTLLTRMEKMEKMRADPLYDPTEPATGNTGAVPDYAKPLEEKLARIERMQLEQQQAALGQRAEATYGNQTAIAKGLVDNWSAGADMKLYAHKPEAKAVVSEKAIERIGAELAYGIRLAIQSGRDPMNHGVTQERARAIYVEEYNRANQYARMFSTPGQVAQQAAINAASGTPGGGASPELGSGKADQEPDTRNRQEWLDYQANRGIALAKKHNLVQQ